MHNAVKTVHIVLSFNLIVVLALCFVTYPIKKFT